MNSVEQKRIIAIIAVLLIVLFVISVARKVVVPEENLTEEQKLQLAETKKEQAIIDDLAGMEERDRIEYYFGEFIRNIELDNYAEAYEVLNEEFKNIYFSTQDKFVEYVKDYFPNEIAVEYNNIERNGNTYILWVKMSNALTVDKSSGRAMNVVIREYAVHDFELSFSVEK